MTDLGSIATMPPTYLAHARSIGPSRQGVFPTEFTSELQPSEARRATLGGLRRLPLPLLADQARHVVRHVHPEVTHGMRQELVRVRRIERVERRERHAHHVLDPLAPVFGRLCRLPRLVDGRAHGVGVAGQGVADGVALVLGRHGLEGGGDERGVALGQAHLAAEEGLQVEAAEDEERQQVGGVQGHAVDAERVLHQVGWRRRARAVCVEEGAVVAREHGVAEHVGDAGLGVAVVGAAEGGVLGFDGLADGLEGGLGKDLSDVCVECGLVDDVLWCEGFALGRGVRDDKGVEAFPNHSCSAVSERYL